MTKKPSFVRFVLAAGLSVPVNIGCRILLSRVVPFEAAVLVSHGVGMLVAWALTRAFVFEASQTPAHHELARFAAVNVLSASLTWLIAVGLVRVVFPLVDWTHAPELVAHVLGLGVAAVTSFFGHRNFSFRRSTASRT